MKRFDDISVRVTWTLVLAAFSVMVAGVGALGLYSNHASRQAFGTLNEVHVEQSQALNRAYVDLLRARIEMDRAAELTRRPAFDRPGPIIERAKALVNESRLAFGEFLDHPSQPGQQESIEELERRYRSLLDTGLALQLMVLEDGDFGAYRSGQSRVTDMSEAFMTGADGFFEATAANGRELSQRFTRVDDWLTATMTVCIVVSFALAVLMLWAMTTHVIRPLRRVIDHFRAITAGNLTEPVGARGGNEIGQLFRELEHMRASLATMVTQLDGSSRHVLTRARRMAEGNHELAARTRQQSISLEQTAAGLDALTAAVADNASGADRTQALTRDTTQKAHEGSAVIDEFVDTMGVIRQRSIQIDEIVGLIDTIAFQTNILALNASVEAARAGQQGKGFAVVAGEVRVLASRCADAACQIRELIVASRASVEQGNALSARASQGMDAIVTAISEVNTLIERIAQASGEQHRGIQQLNLAMSQMEAVTRDNAHLVEVASEDAQALEQEAQRMRKHAARFSIASTTAEKSNAPVWQPRLLDVITPEPTIPTTQPPW